MRPPPWSPPPFVRCAGWACSVCCGCCRSLICSGLPSLVLLLGGFLFVPGFVLLFLGSLLFRFGGSVWGRFFLVLLSGLGFLFLFLVVLLLRIRRSRESQSQRQNGCSDDSN